MTAPASDEIHRAMSRVARATAGLVGAGCVAMLLAYVLHLGGLLPQRRGLACMSPMTALALACLSISIVLDRGPGTRAARLGWICIMVGVAALLAIAAFGQDLLSPFLAVHVFALEPWRSGWIAAPTAICLLALGAADISRDRPRISDRAGALAVGIAGFALLDELYAPGSMQRLPLYGPMAPYTAIAVVLLALASLTMRPHQGWAAVIASPGPGGASTRRLIAFTPLPPLLGWTLVHVADVDRLGTAAAMAALVVLTIVPLALLVLRSGRILDQLEHQRRAQAALQEARDKELRLIADALPVLVAFVDRTLTYRFANRSYERWLGLSPEEVVGRRMPDLVGPDGLRSRGRHIDEVLAGRETRFELDWIFPDGTLRDAEVRFLPRTEPTGTVQGFFVFVADITERKAAERRLLATKEALEERVEARTRERDQIWRMSKDLLCIATLDGYFVSLNPAWTETLGRTLDELTTRPFIHFVHPDDIESTRRAASGLAAGQPALAFENRYRHADGSYRWFSWNAVPDGGRIYATIRDVTETKAAIERERALEEALRQAQKMEAVGQLTGGLAHDFNNLLTGITGSLDLLSLRVSQGRTRELDRYLDAAQSSAKRAAALTHRLLAFARRQTLDPKPTEVDRLVVGLEELVRRTVGPEIAVEIVRGDNLLRVLVDPNQLENALLNLCINARDAIEGSGRITIETANCTFDADAAHAKELTPGAYVALRVSDTGSGMAPDVIERIFDPFFTTKPVGKGTGLGLSMIYGFVRQSGGQVTVDSELGRGTTMSLYLPRYAGPIERERGVYERAAAHAEGGETMLIVDDEPTVRMLVSEVLEELGYKAIEAADGPAGIEILRSDVAIDLLITDVGLPGGMNGRQLADAGRTMRPGLKVLFITGYAETAVLDAGSLETGMRLLPKPFAMDALSAAVKEMIATA